MTAFLGFLTRFFVSGVIIRCSHVRTKRVSLSFTIIRESNFHLNIDCTLLIHNDCGYFFSFFLVLNRVGLSEQYALVCLRTS